MKGKKADFNMTKSAETQADRTFSIDKKYPGDRYNDTKKTRGNPSVLRKVKSQTR